MEQNYILAEDTYNIEAERILKKMCSVFLLFSFCISKWSYLNAVFGKFVENTQKKYKKISIFISKNGKEGNCFFGVVKY